MTLEINPVTSKLDRTLGASDSPTFSGLTITGSGERITGTSSGYYLDFNDFADGITIAPGLKVHEDGSLDPVVFMSRMTGVGGMGLWIWQSQGVTGYPTTALLHTGGTTTGNYCGLLFENANGGATQYIKGGLFFQRTASSGRGSLILAVENTADTSNVDPTDAALTIASDKAATFASTLTATSFIIGANTLDTTEWAYLDGQDQAVKTTSDVSFLNITSVGNGKLIMAQNTAGNYSARMRVQQIAGNYNYPTLQSNANLYIDCSNTTDTLGSNYSGYFSTAGFGMNDGKSLILGAGGVTKANACAGRISTSLIGVIGSGGYYAQHGDLSVADVAYGTNYQPGRYWIICDGSDISYNFAHDLQTNPTLFIHSAAQSTTQWISFAHDGTNGVIDVGTGYIKLLDNAYMDGTKAIYFGSTSASIANDGSNNLSLRGASYVYIGTDLNFNYSGATITCTDSLNITCPDGLYLDGTGNGIYCYDSLTIGDNSAEDFYIKFDGESSDGVLFWMEDEDYFQVADDVLFDKQILIDPTPASDHTATGTVIIATAGENLAFGDAVYLKSDGKFWKSDADAISTMPCSAVAIASISADATGRFLINGFIRDDTWNWTVGGWVYPDTSTAGGFTQVAPSVTGQIVQVIGYAYTADIIWFRPDNTTIEVA